EVDRGGRAYVVCPRIGGASAESSAEARTPDESGQLEVPDMTGEEPAPVTAVEDMVEQLRAGSIFDGTTTGRPHGQPSAEEKDAAMTDFVAGRAPVLVSTTVIEVGVDVPEATLMVIFDAERFGLSQLHQLRGRIGRGSSPGLCLAVTTAPEGSLAQQ